MLLNSNFNSFTSINDNFSNIRYSTKFWTLLIHYIICKEKKLWFLGKIFLNSMNFLNPNFIEGNRLGMTGIFDTKYTENLMNNNSDIYILFHCLICASRINRIEDK